ncbi:hypothetical protein [Bacillus paralicheniformis]|uniref:hypothetical protein n=1 Tax=Bacillus paralicheniformis TaxID=1648923 RepID=UPI002E1EB66C|nr:hypothetical protein [Bacillus paralicheniformis]MED4346908.1 hypothetical protein [Bacillus paralicheniformis]
MKNGYFIIAGKEEGFSYKDAEILRVESEADAEATVNSLRGSGYKIFYITKTIGYIDDIVGVVNR